MIAVQKQTKKTDAADLRLTSPAQKQSEVSASRSLRYMYLHTVQRLDSSLQKKAASVSRFTEKIIHIRFCGRPNTLFFFSF